MLFERLTGGDLVCLRFSKGTEAVKNYEIFAMRLKKTALAEDFIAEDFILASQLSG